MLGRSVSGGVQGLRAVFEQGSSDTSPSSRGRSPAGSVTSDSSRPISKVRTSFISVEKNTQQGSPFAARKMSTSEGSVAGDNANGNVAIRQAANSELVQVNGNADPSDTEAKKEANSHEPETLGGDGAQAPDRNSSGLEESASMDRQPANPDKPTTGAQTELANILPADPKDESTVLGGTALNDDEENLGSVLKGSPFRESSSRPTGPDGSSEDTLPDESPLPSEAKADALSKVNGQPKTPSSASKEALVESTTKTTTPRPPAVDTKKPVSSAGKSQVLKSADKAGTSPRIPATEKSAVGPAKKLPNPSSPRQPAQSNARSSNLDKSAQRAPAASTRQSSSVSKPSTAAPKARKPSSNPNTVPGKNGTQEPPGTKARPRSPTRPVRLPASATAPTQASAAKHEEPPSRSPSRASVASHAKAAASATNKIRPSLSSAGGGASRPRPLRTSLPPPATTTQKPKSRTSTAGTRADGESFLARMMRPTESSSKKTQEKIEVKSPPRKSGAPKGRIDNHQEPKGSPRASGASEVTKLPEQSNGTAAQSNAPENDIEVAGKTTDSNVHAENAGSEETAAQPNGTASEHMEAA